MDIFEIYSLYHLLLKSLVNYLKVFSAVLYLFHYYYLSLLLLWIKFKVVLPYISINQLYV